MILLMVHSNALVIEVVGLSKRYGNTVGAEDVTFNVAPGEVVGFLGPNGSGKTTVMRMLMGLIRPTAGTAHIFGELVTRENHKVRASIGYLPGVLGLYKDMTVREYLQFLADVRKIDCTVRVNELSERLGLKLDSRISGLSKGTKQKVGVIQALMHSPKLLMLDEPTAGLDPIVQNEFQTIIRAERDKGVSVLLSSHVMSEVEELVDRVMILLKGHLVVADTMDALKSRMKRSLRLEFPRPMSPEVFTIVPGVGEVVCDGRYVQCVMAGVEAPLLGVAAQHGVISVTSHEPSLEEIFLEQAENNS